MISTASALINIIDLYQSEEHKTQTHSSTVWPYMAQFGVLQVQRLGPLLFNSSTIGCYFLCVNSRFLIEL